MDPRPLLALLVLSAAFLGGCTDSDAENDGSDEGQDQQANDTNNTTAPPEPVSVDVKLSGIYPGTIAYDPAEIKVPANSSVTVTFTNNDQNPLVSHDWVLEGVDGAATEVIANGETDNVTFLAPDVGSYKFYCSVPGHRDNGMEGDFIVE